MFVATFLALGVAGRALACPSPASLKSDVSVLVHNDLVGQSTLRTESLLVLSSALSATDAASACSQLGEELWSPKQEDFLDYLVYKNQSTQYWVKGSSGPTCADIASNSSVQASCADTLPTLCTNHGPISNLTYKDNSTQWQVAVETQNATITGFRDKYSFRFQGLRYAPQPERFNYSTLHTPSGTENGLAFGNECVQSGNIGSEDCLFLNVWTPSLPQMGGESDLKPVMFWIHGGGFTGGNGSDATFDGGAMAARGDVVLVTINYRLSTFGFLALDDGVTNGNYGLQDQITALDWVHANIKAFGGDPSRITIFGQSAGAASVRALMASPVAIGKYAAAIQQSNLAGSNFAATYSNWLNISAEVELAARPLLNATGCLNATSQVDCLRGVNAYELANITRYAAKYPVVDGTYLTTGELVLTGAGPAAKVPLMMGFMRDDGGSFFQYPKPNVSIQDFLPTIGFPLNASELALYPTPDSGNATLNVYNTSVLVLTDGEFRCLDTATAYSGVKNGVFEDVYFYQFNRSYQLGPGFPDANAPVCDAPIEPGYPHGNPNREYFKCHSGELYFAFGTLAFNGLPLRDDDDLRFQQFTLDSWTAFARTYSPNPDLDFLAARGFTNTSQQVQAAGPWPAVAANSTTGPIRVMQWPVVQGDYQFGATQEQCNAQGYPLNYWDSI